MISVAENDPRIEIGRFEFFKTDAFDGAGRADRHEDRCLDLSPTCFKYTSASFSILSVYLKAQCWRCTFSHHALCHPCYPWLTFYSSACASQQFLTAWQRSRTLPADDSTSNAHTRSAAP